MEDNYIKLAKQAVDLWVKNNEQLKPPPDTPEEMLNQQKGVFVTLRRRGELRGCIGTFEPTRQNIAQEIINNAISAASKDPRFPPLPEDELGEIEISVDVLSSPEPCQPRDLDPNEYGVIVEKGGRRGLLLPDISGVDTVDQQLNIAKRKAGISPRDEDIQIRRFKVERHER